SCPTRPAPSLPPTSRRSASATLCRTCRSSSGRRPTCPCRWRPPTGRPTGPRRSTGGTAWRPTTLLPLEDGPAYNGGVPTTSRRNAIMLRELAVQNLALIEDVRVELEPGFCAWTGETGAGKSLLLGALGMLLGDRGSADLIRAGAEELRVTGRFEVDSPEVRKEIETLLG